MCKAMEDMRNQTAKEKALQIAKNLIANGVAFEIIAECCQLTVEEVKALEPQPA